MLPRYVIAASPMGAPVAIQENTAERSPKTPMLKRCYDWIVSYANHPKAVPVLFWVTFMESAFSPIPPIPLLIPMCIANPKRSWYYALVCTAGACAGGFLGYGIGHLLYESVGKSIIEFYGLAEAATHLRAEGSKFWFWVLITKGLTPIPFKIVTIMSGVLEYNIPLFFIGMFVSRLTFFFMFAVAIQFYGENIRTFIEKHLPLATGILLFFVIGGFFVLPLVL
jgi:membrane protein YqaA with SNARE-associated domain